MNMSVVIHIPDGPDMEVNPPAGKPLVISVKNGDRVVGTLSVRQGGYTLLDDAGVMVAAIGSGSRAARG
jgi:hypothetical protein